MILDKDSLSIVMNFNKNPKEKLHKELFEKYRFYNNSKHLTMICKNTKPGYFFNYYYNYDGDWFESQYFKKKTVYITVFQRNKRKETRIKTIN